MSWNFILCVAASEIFNRLAFRQRRIWVGDRGSYISVSPFIYGYCGPASWRWLVQERLVKGRGYIRSEEYFDLKRRVAPLSGGSNPQATESSRSKPLSVLSPSRITLVAIMMYDCSSFHNEPPRMRPKLPRLDLGLASSY